MMNKKTFTNKLLYKSILSLCAVINIFGPTPPSSPTSAPITNTAAPISTVRRDLPIFDREELRLHRHNHETESYTRLEKIGDTITKIIIVPVNEVYTEQIVGNVTLEEYMTHRSNKYNSLTIKLSQIDPNSPIEEHEDIGGYYKRGDRYYHVIPNWNLYSIVTIDRTTYEAQREEAKRNGKPIFRSSLQNMHLLANHGISTDMALSSQQICLDQSVLENGILRFDSNGLAAHLEDIERQGQENLMVYSKLPKQNV